MIIDAHLFNVSVAGAASILTNVIMLLAVYRSSRMAKAYKVQMYVSAALGLIYTAINVFTNPTIAVLPVDRTVLIVKGGFDTAYEIGLYLLDAFIFLIIITALHPTVQYGYRYLHIVHGHRRQLWDRPCTWFLVLIPIFLSLSSSAFFCVQLEPTKEEILRYNRTSWSINVQGYTSFLVSSVKYITHPTLPTSDFETNNVMISSILYMTLCMFVASVTVVLTSISVSRNLGTKTSSFSAATFRLHRQLNKTLIAQAFVPLITIHIPFYVCFFAPSFGWNVYFASDFLPYLFSYYAVLLPITVVYYCKDVRRMAFSLCRKKTTDSLTQSSSNARNAWVAKR